MMKALVVPEHGGPEVLGWEDVPDPEPGPGEVLVRVRAVAVNWADLLMRAGRYPGAPDPPFIAGHELMGEVVGRGPGTTGPPDGARVFGVLERAGASAELVAARADLVHVLPDRLSDQEGAALASPFFTADAALVTLGRLSEGESVLVHAAAGGFGSAAVQLARAYGAGLIVATAGAPEKLERVREWGADILVDYTTDDFVPAVLEATGGQGVDLVMESVGGEVLGASFDCVRPAGRLVSVGASSGRSSKRFRLQTLFEKGISVAGFTLGLWLREHPELVAPTVERVVDAVSRGAVQVVIGGVFPADQIADAHRFLGERRSIGRTVVVL
jgi:NADPH:quinone reductase